MKKKKQALITVEATLVLPVFIFVIYIFLYFYQILMVQEVLHVSATKTARELSSYGIVANLLMKDNSQEKAEGISHLSDDSKQGMFAGIFEDIDLSAVKGKMVDCLYLSNRLAPSLEDKVVIKHCIQGGYNGIQFYGSSLFDDEECVTITMNYKIKFPLFQQVLPKLPVVQTVRMRSFNGCAAASQNERDERGKEGSEKEKLEEEMVYITEHGSVYHTNKMCTSLKISVSAYPSSLITSKRNRNGAKYYPCERCFDKGDPLPDNVYITTYGNRYHKNADCTAIDRTILTVPISEVSNRRLCKRCQQYH